MLAVGGLDGGFGQGSCVADLAVGQPLGQPRGPGAADRGRGLVARQELERAGVGHVQGPLQGREHAQQGAAQAVHGAGAVLDQVDPASGQQLELDGGFVAGVDGPQVAAHPGLVGNDVGVAGVGLALTAVTVGSPVHQAAGNVEDLLAVIDQQGQQQRGFPAGHVDGPGDLTAVGQVQDVTDELQQLGLVVDDPPRQQGLPVGIQRQAVMVALATVDPRPYPAHHAPDVLVRTVRATDDLAGIALHSDLFALPNRRPSRRGAPDGEASEATKRQQPDSHTQHPWATQPYEWLDQPGQEGRAA